jgi:hypothetical protein
MLFGTGALVARPKKHGETCIADGICSRCSILNECGLPQALSAKQSL